jgi:hypothetical protein
VTGETQHHQLSLAIWDVPSTAVAGEPFTIKAGAKSSTECSLQGGRIEACNAAGQVIASGVLGSARWPGTSALHWTELSLRAPAQHGMASLSVRFATPGFIPPHGDATARISIMVVPPPKHMLTIQVVEQETATPIGDAEIRLGTYRATTTASGRVELHLANGQYELRIWKVGYEAQPHLITVKDDALVEVAAVIVPEENADRAWRA